jgi:hypothetical protein
MNIAWTCSNVVIVLAMLRIKFDSPVQKLRRWLQNMVVCARSLFAYLPPLLSLDLVSRLPIQNLAMPDTFLVDFEVWRGI